MKKRLILIIFIFATSYCGFTQTPEELRFLGTWKWKNDHKELVLFMKYDTIASFAQPFGAVIGFHKYTRNDSISQDYIPLYLPDRASYKTASFGGLLDRNDSSVLICSIFDKEMNKNGRLYLTFIYPDQLKFELMSMNAPQGKGAGFSLPTGIILTKQH